MGHTRQRHEAWNYAGPAAASPTWLGMCLVLTFEWRALLPSGLGHQPALRPPVGASSWVSEALQGGLTESLIPHTAPRGE